MRVSAEKDHHQATITNILKYITIQCKLCPLHGIPNALQRLLQYKIYITLYKNCWVCNVLSGDCIQWKLRTKWAKFTYVGKQTKFITKLCKNSSLKINFF
jgi:hypothetical protein